MFNYDLTQLEITAADGQPVANKLWRQNGPASTLALLFPGLQYNCDLPLLYYPTKLLLERGADVLQLRTDYTQWERPERGKRLLADAQALLVAGRGLRPYTHLVLVGKSIGTMAQAHLVEMPAGKQAITIWLTPLLHQPELVAAVLQVQVPALFVAGSGDDLYESTAWAKILQKPGTQGMLIEGANHSLELPSSVHQSLAALNQVMQTMAEFLDRSLE